MPLLIGGATTSTKHTAVKIAPNYESTVVHVKDASRSRRRRRPPEPSRGPARARPREPRLPGDRARSPSRRSRRGTSSPTPRPWRSGSRSTGRTHPGRPRASSARETLDDIPLAEIVPYIDWSPFFAAWELRGKYPKILDRPGRRRRRRPRSIGDARQAPRHDRRGGPAQGPRGLRLLPGELRGRRHHRLDRRDADRSSGRGSTPSASNGSARARRPSGAWPTTSPRSGIPDYLGAFAVTAGIGADELARKFEADHDDYNAIMTKALADRLAEALAEKLHQQARRDWGFGQDEAFTHRRPDRREVSRHPPRPRLPRVPGSHREVDPLVAPRREGGDGHLADREPRDGPRRLGLAASISAGPSRATSRST